MASNFLGNPKRSGHINIPSRSWYRICSAPASREGGNRINKRLTIIVHATRVIPAEHRRAMPMGVCTPSEHSNGPNLHWWTGSFPTHPPRAHAA